MTSIKSTDDNIAEPAKSEMGVTLPLVALMMVTLLGIASFAVDLGWFYLNASRIQRAADAAALAGVIHMPNDPTEAFNVAHDIAQSNGYEDLEVPGVFPQVVAATVPLQPNQLRVTVTEQVPTFFLKVFGMSNQVITRTAQAEYVPPLRLGSPFSTMGNDPNCFSPASPSNPCSGNFWIGIYGTHINTSNGDPFGSFCLSGAVSSTCPQNPLYRPEGYLFGVVPSTNSLTIQALDPQHRYNGGAAGGYGDTWRTGDNKPSPGTATTPGPTTTYTLWDADNTPEVIADNTTVLCSATYASQPQINNNQAPPFSPPDPTWIWSNVCSGVSVVANRTYVLQVQVDGVGADDDGSNRFSLRVGSGNGKLFAIRDFSVFFNSSAADSYLYLAEVPEIYKGKTFVVEGFDPGDISGGGSGNLELRYPTGSGTWAAFPTCDAWVKDSVADPTWSLIGTLTPCSVSVNNSQPLSSPQNFQNKWFKLEAVLPSTYSCSSNCWWQMAYVGFSQPPRDHVTWRAYVEGNPIHLVPAS